uniref:Ig-like domain-containing protein n=1 Tax=Astatotilapia calliptera TaxID=8154 RepID=A0AAX7UEH1_ASTCA
MRSKKAPGVAVMQLLWMQAAVKIEEEEEAAAAAAAAAADMEILAMKSKETVLKFLCIALLIVPIITTGKEHGPGVVTVVVPEGSDPVLPCSPTTKENLEEKLFDWKKVGPNKQEVFFYDGGTHYNNGHQGQHEHFSGRVFHFSDQLRFGNASIIIRNAQITDSGDYICVFPRLQPAEETFNVKLLVGAALKPYIWIVNITEDRAMLRCEVRGASPKPKVEWRDSDGNILHAEEPQVSRRGERYDITLLTTVTRTNINLFYCVATQEGISHKIDAEIYVPYCAAAPKPDITVLGATESGVQLKCHVGGVHPKPKLQWKDSDGNVLSAEDPVVSERGGRYNVTLCTIVTPTKTNCFHCVVEQEGSYQVIDQEINLSENLFKHTYSKVTAEGLLIGMFLGAFIVSVVVAVLMATGKLKISSDEGSQRNANGSLNGEVNSPQSNGQNLESKVLMEGQG